MLPCEAEIGHADILERVLFSGRSTRCVAKIYCDLLEALDRNGCNNRIPVREM